MHDADAAADLELLLAGSHPGGEDLLQAALERLLRRGRRIDGSLEAYLRRTLYNLAADGWRRQRLWRRKLPMIQAGHPPAEQDVTAAVDLRDALMRILGMLPPQQRAVIVLRYWEQLTEVRRRPPWAAPKARSSRRPPAGLAGCGIWPAPGWQRRSS